MDISKDLKKSYAPLLNYWVENRKKLLYRPLLKLEKEGIFLIRNSKTQVESDKLQVYRIVAEKYKNNGNAYVEDGPNVHVLAELVYEKLFKKYRRWVLKKVAAGKFQYPLTRPSIAMYVALERGFISPKEAGANYNINAWTIKFIGADLVWPKSFNTQQDAIPIFEEIGIPGYTSIKPPINQKQDKQIKLHL